MVKIEKERKFKTEYIPVYISSIILVLFFALLILTINYEGKPVSDSGKTSTNAQNEELAITKTDSKCSQEQLSELLNLANGVSGDYELSSRDIPLELTPENAEYYKDHNGVKKYRFIEITLKGLKEGIYAQISNNFNNDVKIIKVTDLNEEGTYKYEAPNMERKITYTVDIFAEKYDCNGELIRKVSFETKVYNSFNQRTGCIMYPNYENCATFLDEEITPEDFMTGLDKYKETHKEQEKQAQANLISAFEGNIKVNAEDINGTKIDKKTGVMNKFVKKVSDNKDLIAIACVTIGLGVLVVVLIMFIRRHRL